MANTIPPPGTKITLVVVGLFGNHIKIKGVVLGKPEHHGFKTKGGGWAYFKIAAGDKPSYRFLFREYRKKRASWVKIDDVISINEGWDD